ncbi:MAG: hypothetical protein ACK559_22790, partial [bacterium]
MRGRGLAIGQQQEPPPRRAGREFVAPILRHDGHHGPADVLRTATGPQHDALGLCPKAARRPNLGGQAARLPRSDEIGGHRANPLAELLGPGAGQRRGGGRCRSIEGRRMVHCKTHAGNAETAASPGMEPQRHAIPNSVRIIAGRRGIVRPERGTPRRREAPLGSDDAQATPAGSKKRG